MGSVGGWVRVLDVVRGGQRGTTLGRALFYSNGAVDYQWETSQPIKRPTLQLPSNIKDETHRISIGGVSA